MYQPGKSYRVRCLRCTLYLGSHKNVTTGVIDFYCKKCKGTTRVYRDGTTLKEEFIPRGYNEPPEQPHLKAV